eukprot:4161108-Amphidinium_carterae.1
MHVGTSAACNCSWGERSTSPSCCAAPCFDSSLRMHMNVLQAIAHTRRLAARAPRVLLCVFLLECCPYRLCGHEELPRVTRDICDVAIKQTSYAREE